MASVCEEIADNIEDHLRRSTSASGTEGAETARREDPYVALAGVTNQMKDAAAAFISMKPVIDAMNSLASEISNKSKAEAREPVFRFAPRR